VFHRCDDTAPNLNKVKSSGKVFYAKAMILPKENCCLSNQGANVENDKLGMVWAAVCLTNQGMNVGNDKQNWV
jgi:hypothetical protein